MINPDGLPSIPRPYLNSEEFSQLRGQGIVTIRDLANLDLYTTLRLRGYDFPGNPKLTMARICDVKVITKHLFFFVRCVFVMCWLCVGYVFVTASLCVCCVFVVCSLCVRYVFVMCCYVFVMGSLCVCYVFVVCLLCVRYGLVMCLLWVRYVFVVCSSVQGDTKTKTIVFIGAAYLRWVLHLTELLTSPPGSSTNTPTTTLISPNPYTIS